VKDEPVGSEEDGNAAARPRRAAEATPISHLGYEKCRDELVEVVRLLEQGELDLDASLELWERGEQLAKRCEEHLAGARKRVSDALAAGDQEES
jgi:exodeoxyribonuclease VII small subunit